MTLGVGNRIGPYEIVGALGAGGLGRYLVLGKLGESRPTGAGGS